MIFQGQSGDGAREPPFGKSGRLAYLKARSEAGRLRILDMQCYAAAQVSPSSCLLTLFVGVEPCIQYGMTACGLTEGIYEPCLSSYLLQSCLQTPRLDA